MVVVQCIKCGRTISGRILEGDAAYPWRHKDNYGRICSGQYYPGRIIRRDDEKNKNNENNGISINAST